MTTKAFRTRELIKKLSDRSDNKLTSEEKNQYSLNAFCKKLVSNYPVKNFPKNNGIECVHEDIETFLLHRECIPRL